MGKEIAQRVGHAWGAFREGRRKIYRNRLVQPQRRFDMLSSFVLFRLFVGAGAWPPLNKGESRAVHGAVYSMYRPTLCLGRNVDPKLHAGSIRAQLGASSPVVLLRAARLRYASQMSGSAPDELWAIVTYCKHAFGLR